jgi:tetratricopeptide (TPR) repeat protein
MTRCRPVPQQTDTSRNIRTIVRWRYAAAALLAVASLLVATAVPLRADEWIEIKSANVTVNSSAGAGTGRNLAWQIEQVRAVVKTLWPWARVDLDRPFTVLAVDDEKGMRALAPVYWETRGAVKPLSVWESGPDQHMLAIRADYQGPSKNNLNPYISAYFAYLNLVLDQSVDVPMPEWFSRGLAGVLSNTIVQESQVLVGPAIPWHIEVLREGTRLHLVDLVKVNRESLDNFGNQKLNRFYAESWAFVHFLMFDKQGSRSAQLNQYFKLVAGGAPPGPALRETLGNVEDLEAEFATYVTRRVFSHVQLKVNLSVKRDEFAERTLPPSEVASLRARFHVAMKRPIEARAAIAEARKADPAAPESYVAEGRLLETEHKPDEARAAFAQAVAAGSKSEYAYFRLANLRWTPGVDRDALQDIEKLLRQSIMLNSRHAEAYAMLAELRSELGNHESLGLAIRATQLEPARSNHQLVVARILARRKEYDEAAKAVGVALSLATTPEEIRAAEELKERIEKAR